MRTLAIMGVALMMLAFLPAGFRLTHFGEAHAQRASEQAEVVTANGSYSFSVEIADTDQSRSQGLMFRKHLGDREGMLFFYDREQPITMWMQNTYISLDMIFIKADGRVHRIAEHTEPFSEKVIGSGGPVLAVLEVKAGTADKLGIKPGDRIEHPRLKATGH